MSDEPSNQSQILFYQTGSGDARVEVRLERQHMCGCRNCSWRNCSKKMGLPTINEHLKNLYAEGDELTSAATIRKFRIVRQEGSRQVSRQIDHYNLEAIIAVGYRVRSHRGTQFRKWATARLNEFLIKGFTLDDQRLKEGRSLGADYFDELLERIRDIRASEKRFYRKIRDIYKLSIDYDPKIKETQQFFQLVQNKLHWAISGMTAAELIAERADASKPNMGLTTWKGKVVRKGDVTTAKNYLNKDEVSKLNRLVTMYLDFAEDQAERGIPLYMQDWREKLDAFLRFNGREVLEHLGSVEKAIADQLALEQYETFSTGRLKKEARSEALADDEELREHQRRLERKDFST